MGAVVSGSQVGEHLDRLEERFGSFPVDQTTVSVESSVYDRARERASEGVVDAIVRVWNDDGDVLHVQDEDDWRLPRHRTMSVDGIAETVEREVWAGLAVDCDVDGVDRVTITGVRNRDDLDADTLYRLLVVVDASLATGEPCEEQWRPLDRPTSVGRE